jgi:tripartite ATP-independent transporter DctP family solute receptor
MMKKMLALSLSACILTLVGCSSQATTNKGSSPSSTPTEKQPEAKTANAKVMKIGLTEANDTVTVRELKKFGEKVEKETGGSVKVKVYPDGQLGSNDATISGLKGGTIQATMMSPGTLSPTAKSFFALDLPYLFKDEQTAYRVLDGPVGKELLDSLSGTGMVGIDYWELGYRNLTNNKREVKTIDDIKGLKLRTLQNKVHIDFWGKLGAAPTPIDFTELFTSMAQGVVDGQENPAGLIKAKKFNEVQKYLTLTEHLYSPNVFLISQSFWDSLSDKEKETITKVAEEVKVEQRKLNQQEDKDAMEYLKQHGMQVTELTPEEKQKFIDKARTLYQDYSSTIGDDLLKKLLEAVK